MPSPLFNGILYALLLLMIVLLVLFSYYISLIDSEVVVNEHGNGTYKVHEINGLLSKSECKKLMKIAQTKKMERSNVWDYNNGIGNVLNENQRLSYQTWLSEEDDIIVRKLADVSEELTKIPRENQELLQVVRYEPGGLFHSHYDACTDNTAENCTKMNMNSGQRRCTLLIYLNDDFEGGETEFEKIGIKIKPKAGTGILFWGTFADGSVINESMHRGNEVSKGEKWICTVWSHQFPYAK